MRDGFRRGIVYGIFLGITAAGVLYSVNYVNRMAEEDSRRKNERIEEPAYKIKDIPDESGIPGHPGQKKRKKHKETRPSGIERWYNK